MRLRDKLVKSEELAVLVRWPDMSASWTKVRNRAEIKSIEAEGGVIVQSEKLVDDFSRGDSE